MSVDETIHVADFSKSITPGHRGVSHVLGQFTYMHVELQKIT